MGAGLNEILFFILVASRGWAVKITRIMLWCFWSAECCVQIPIIAFVSLSKILLWMHVSYSMNNSNTKKRKPVVKGSRGFATWLAYVVFTSSRLGSQLYKANPSHKSLDKRLAFTEFLRLLQTISLFFWGPKIGNQSKVGTLSCLIILQGCWPIRIEDLQTQADKPNWSSLSL